jgi:hypothetical protein
MGASRMKKILVFLVVLAFSVAGIGLTGVAQAKSPWEVHWVGKKPDLDGRMLRIERFSLRKDAVPHMKYRVLLPMLQAFADGRKEEAKYSALEATWGEFNEIFGVVANVSTFVEHAMFVAGLAKVNGHFTNLGAALGGLQVILDIASNNHRAAVVNTYKTVQGYWLGKLGTAGMQIGSVAAFVVDYWLTDVRETTWKNHKDRLRIAYTKYYKKGHKGYREINKWKTRIHKIYDDSRKNRFKFKSAAEAKKMQSIYFSHHLDKLIDAHTNEFWHDLEAADEISDSKLLRSFRGESNADRAALRVEYRTRLIRQFARRVFPELTHRTWEKWAEHELKYNMNGKGTYSLVSKLNKVFTLEVRAYGLEQPASLLIHRPTGKPWEGLINPGRKVGVKMTKIAFIRAGLPDKISMIVGDKTTTLPFHFGKNDRASVSFGVPKLIAVTTYDRQESAQSCKVRKIHKTKKTEQFTETRAAASGPVHMTTSANGETVIGRYSLKQGKWLEASVGKTVVASTPGATPSSLDMMKGSRMEVAYSATFFPPYYDDIKALEKCKGAVTMLGTTEVTCTAKRYKRKQVLRSVLIERHCTSSITLKMKNYFMVSGKQKGIVVDAGQLKNIEKQAAKEMQNMQNLLKNLPKP